MLGAPAFGMFKRASPERNQRAGGRSVAESPGGAGFGLGGLFFAVLRWSSSLQRTQQPGRNAGHFINRSQKRGFIGLRRFGESADLPHELQRCAANLVIRNWRIEIEKRFDVSAHFGSLLF
jgi:hypothetical protein